MEQYSSDFKSDLLKAETLASNFALPDVDRMSVTLQDVVTYAKTLTEIQKDLMSEVCKLLKWILVMPGSNKCCKRAIIQCFSKNQNFLQATMTQWRLNNLMVLNIHKDQYEKLDLVDVANTFVAGSEHRLSLFGKFMQE